MNCPSCRHENPPAAKFCLECGTKLQRACPKCGVELPPAARFCMECGAALSSVPAEATSLSLSLEAQFALFQQGLPQAFREHLLTPAEGENRLVTVLFADMSSSVQATREMHAEDAAALVNRLLKAMVDVLLKHEGRVDRFLGDGVLAVFGVPQAHESDPERAILAALEIREAAQEQGLEVTAGINTGEVYVGGMGSERHQEVTVMGPAVNLAARLQSSAQPGQILVGEATYRLTRRAFEFSPLTLEIKGLDRPVAAYAAARALPRPEKVRGIEGLRADLIGRDDEFARLREALDELRQGRGQMVSLIGEAGVGKSRLVAELKAIVGSRQTAGGSNTASQGPTASCRLPTAYWLEGRCLELGMSASYWLFVDLFREYFAWAPEEDDRARGERIAAALRQLVEGGALREPRAEEMGPLLGNLLSARFGTDWDERLKNAAPEQIRHQTFQAIRDFFSALAQQQPLVLVCEDLHWADTLSLDVISLLMETLTRDPILLVCVYRPEREHKCWRLGAIAAEKCAGRYTEIQLRELTPQHSRRLVDSLLAIDDLPKAVKELILEKSRGNPFFVEEVVRSLIDAGMVYLDGKLWRAREGIESVAVPESVQSVILSRVDRLERDLRGVLENASVIGRLFRRRVLEYTAQGTTELERALWELEDRQLIYQDRVLPEEEYSFKHVLTQETVYRSMLRRRRAAFHEKVAAALEALYGDGLEEYYEQLAYHYERSGNDEKAVEYLLKAGEKARLAYDNEEAIGCFQRAIERLERSSRVEAHPRWRLEALRGLGQSYSGIGKQSEAEECFRQAIIIGKEIGLTAHDLARLYFGLGEALWWQNRYDERGQVAQEGLSLLGDDRESVEAVLMNSLLDLGSSPEYSNRNAQLLPRLPYSEDLRAAYIHLYIRCSREGRSDEAQQWLDALARQAEQHHDQRAIGEAHYFAGELLAHRGDLAGALARYQQGVEVFTRIGDANRRTWPSQVIGRLHLALGQRAEARRALQVAAERKGPSPGASGPRLARILGALEEAYDDPEEFRAYCRQLREEHREWGPAPLVQWYLEPAEPGRDFVRLVCHLRFNDAHGERFVPEREHELWASHNLSPECAVARQETLEIHPVGGANLHHATNLAAPRLLRRISGDFAAQTVCGPISDEMPAVGGLLLWKDEANFLRLEKATFHRNEISFQGSLGGTHLHCGRGRLPTARVHLRLERRGHRVDALCSADGAAWFTVGWTELPVEDPVEVGVHALGAVERAIYSGLCVGGPAIRFEAFDLWGSGDEAATRSIGTGSVSAPGE